MMKPWGLILVLLGAAFVLRLYRLGALSFWYDEGYSLLLARFSLWDAARWTARDIVPPFYYHLLHFWLRWVGEAGEFGARLLSVYVGMLALSLGYQVGRRLFGRSAGLLTLLLMVFSPLYLRHAQDARMYMLLTMAALAAIWALTGILFGGARRFPLIGWWGVWGISLGILCYTHTVGLFLTAAQVAVLAFFSWRQGRLRERLGPVLLVGGILFVSYLPWLWMVRDQFAQNAGYFPGTLLPLPMLTEALASFATGDAFVYLTSNFPTIVLLVIFLLALLVLFRRRTDPSVSHGTVALLLLLFVPLFIMAVIFYKIPKFSPRYAAAASPAFFVLLGGGLALLGQSGGWRRWLAGVGLLSVIGLWSYGIWEVYTDVRLYNDDFRGAAHYISEHIAPDETVLLLSGHFFPVWDYYYQGEWTPLPDISILDLNRRLNYSVAETLNSALANRRGVWVIHWQDEVIDPNGYTAMLLGQEGQRETIPSYFKGVGLTHYRWDQAPHFSSEPEIQMPLEGAFGPVELLGYSQTERDVVTFFWRTREPLTRDYQVALRLVDGQGRDWGSRDQRPASYLYPTDYWRPGDIVFGRAEIPMEPGTPQGNYYLRISLYDKESREPLPLYNSRGEWLGEWQTAPVTLTRRWGMDEFPTERVTATAVDFDSTLKLVGYRRSMEQVGAGMPVDVDFYCFVQGPVVNAAALRLSWISNGSAVLSATLPLVEGYETARWVQGEFVRGRYTVRVPLTAGEYGWELQALDAQGEPIGAVAVLPGITVQAGEPMLTELPGTPRFPAAAEFEGGIALLGADLSAEVVRPGDTVSLTLYWRADGIVPERDLTVYTHLMGSAGQPVAQHDGVPAAGNRPVRSWRTGEIIVDVHPWKVPVDLPAGTYPIRVGLYAPVEAGMPRVMVNNPSAGTGPADGVMLGGLNVRP